MALRSDPSVTFVLDRYPNWDAYGLWGWRHLSATASEVAAGVLAGSGEIEWRQQSQGVKAEPLLLLPRLMVGSLVLAVQEFAAGKVADPDTEAKVLRESLDIERRRVDDLLKRARTI